MTCKDCIHDMACYEIDAFKLATQQLKNTK